MIIDLKLLQELVDNKLDIYEISETLNINHKTLRCFLKENNIVHNIKLIKEHKLYYTVPLEEDLLSPLSILAHSIYLCEGWHTNKTNTLHFFNQDVQLIKIFCKCLKDIYHYKKAIPIIFVYNPNDVNSQNIVNQLILEFNDSNLYKIQYASDSSRKNPIIRVKTGGHNLAKIFIENAYKILHSA